MIEWTSSVENKWKNVVWKQKKNLKYHNHICHYVTLWIKNVVKYFMIHIMWLPVSHCIVSLPFQLSAPPTALLPANRCLQSGMVSYWAGCQCTLSRLASSASASLSCDWLLDGTEAEWSQCPTSRIATRLREMRKGETEGCGVCVW